MKPIYKTILIAALVIGAVGLSTIGIASAQGGDDPRPWGSLTDLLGLDREEIHDRLQAGSTIQELAQEAGIDLEAFREEMQVNRSENMRERIEGALAGGEISQDQADWLLEGLEKGYLDSPFFRAGGRGGARPGTDGSRTPGMQGGISTSDQ
jgi:hypothetical protein